MADAREARRQRILRRGSDRLAYITGERKQLEKQGEDLKAQDNVAEILPSRTETPIQAAQDAEPEIEEQEVFHRQQVEFEEQQALQEQLVRALAGAGKSLSERRTALVDAKVQNAAEVAPKSKSKSGFQHFSLQDLSASVDQSRGVRAVLSVALAIFFATIQVLVGECKQDSISSSAMQPMMAVLTTSASLVLLFTVLRSSKPQQAKQKNEDLGSSRVDEVSTTDVNLDKLSQALAVAQKTLGSALLVSKCVRALSIDVSIYLVAVACFLPVVQPWTSSLCTSV